MIEVSRSQILQYSFFDPLYILCKAFTSFYPSAKINIDQIMLIQMRAVFLLFGYCQILKYPLPFIRFPEKRSHHICHDRFPKPPGSRDTAITVSFSKIRHQLL